MSPPFVVFPAIDLKGGRVVRLKQGRANAETIYSDDPAAVARRWENQNARFLHVVDLDGAFEGEPRNWDGVRAIVENLKISMSSKKFLRIVIRRN